MKFTEEHEWMEAEGDVFVVGITEHATEQLGDLVFVELPEVGDEVSQGDEIVVIESVKAVLTSRIPMSRLGNGEDVANSVAFLSSDQASYITGETIHVNGGMYMA